MTHCGLLLRIKSPWPHGRRRLASRISLQSSPHSTLSGGQQQMLVIGRAMMAGPQLLLLDEPSLGSRRGWQVTLVIEGGSAELAQDPQIVAKYFGLHGERILFHADSTLTARLAALS